MGYRSDVAIRIEVDNENAKGLKAQDVYEDLCKRAENILEQRMVTDVLEEVRIDDEAGILTLAWSYVKWYDSYEDVQFVTEWFNEMADCADYYESDDSEGCGSDNESFGMGVIKGCHFVRIGEEYEDIEEKYYGWLEHPLNIIRMIDIDTY